MGISREELNRWLKHAARLEAEPASNEDEPVILGPPDAEPWTPREPDPFGMKWQWLLAAAPDSEPAAAADGETQTVAAVQHESPRVSGRRFAGLVTANRVVLATAATLLIGVALGGWVFRRGPGDPGGELVITDLLATSALATVRSVEDPDGNQWEVSFQSSFAGFVCAIALDASGSATVIPGIAQDAIPADPTATTTVTLPVATQQAVLIVTEQPVSFELYRALQRSPLAGSSPEELRARVVEELRYRNFRRVAVSVVSP